jgi:hypothetical protein
MAAPAGRVPTALTRSHSTQSFDDYYIGQHTHPHSDIVVNLARFIGLVVALAAGISIFLFVTIARAAVCFFMAKWGILVLFPFTLL